MLVVDAYIRVWASALLDLDRRAMRDAFEKWDEQRVQRPTLFYICTRTKSKLRTALNGSVGKATITIAYEMDMAFCFISDCWSLKSSKHIYDI